MLTFIPERYIVNRDGTIYDKVRKENIKQFNSNGYLQCYIIANDGKRHVVGVHTVIAIAHCHDWFPKCVVHHKDGDKHNNCADNLECLDISEHSRRHVQDGRNMNFANYIKERGPANKGKKMSKEYCLKCSESAKRRWERERNKAISSQI